MKDHQPLTQADIGRVYVHGTSVRVMLLNHLGDEPFQVTIKCMEPTEDDRYIVAQVDSRNLVPTSQRIFPNAPDYVNGLPGFSGAVEPGSVPLMLTPVQAALLHSIVRESGWSYTEASGHEQIATDLLEIADLLTAARTATGTVDVKRPDHHKVLFDAQFDGVSDRRVITGEDDRDTDCSCWATSRNGCPKHAVTK